MGGSRRGRGKRPGAHAEASVRGPAHGPAAAGKRSLNLVLDGELIHRLKALALLRRCTASELVAEWGEQATKGLVLAVRRPGEVSGDRVITDESETGGPAAGG